MPAQRNRAASAARKGSWAPHLKLPSVRRMLALPMRTRPADSARPIGTADPASLARVLPSWLPPLCALWSSPPAAGACATIARSSSCSRSFICAAGDSRVTQGPLCAGEHVSFNFMV